MPLRPFHLAFPVYDLATTRHFYETVLGCSVGRTDTRWIDFNFFGHQITAHLVDDPGRSTVSPNRDPIDRPMSNAVDGHAVPVSHWGVILTPEVWQSLCQQLQAHAVDFIIQPHTRFAGQPGEQSTLFIRDPSGHALEFKSFQADEQIFASNP